jgi:D-sorbitol dehydrogenase-like protein
MTDITRRRLLSGVTAAAATTAFGSILDTPQLAFADSPESPELTFSKISELLTGINQKILSPVVDPLALNHEIYTKANEKNAAILQAMLQKFAAAGTDNEKKVAVTKMMKPATGDEQGEKMRFLGRSIILAWYLGAWYAPEDLRQHFYDPASKDPTHYSYRRYSKNVLISHTVLSANAYTGSMVWRAMQAHPMGYSNLQFGYWAQNPPDIVAFITLGEASK